MANKPIPDLWPADIVATSSMHLATLELLKTNIVNQDWEAALNRLAQAQVEADLIDVEYRRLKYGVHQDNISGS